MTVEPGDGFPSIDPELFEHPANQTARALLEALLVWATQTELPGTEPGEFSYMVRALEGLYRDEVVKILPMTDEEVGQSGIFMMAHRLEQEEEKVIIVLHIHLKTVMEAIDLVSESERKAVLKGFARVARDVIDRYKELQSLGVRFPH